MAVTPRSVPSKKPTWGQSRRHPLKHHCTSEPQQSTWASRAQVVPPTGGGEDDVLYRVNITF